MELSIIILNYKRQGLVKNCLRSIGEIDFDQAYEIIVVDNDSGDKIEQMLAEKFPQVRFIQSGANLGMGGGNNVGIRAARGRFVLVVNPDIYIFPETISKLYNFIKEKPEVGLVAPRLLNADRTLQHTCYRWHRTWTPLYRRTFLGKLGFAQKELDRFLMMDWDHETTQEVDWLQASCVLASKKILAEVGYFDDRFFMYFEDTDLCRRIKLAGYKNIYHPEAEVIHLHRRQSADGGIWSVLFNRMTREHIISWFKYSRKWRGKIG